MRTRSPSTASPQPVINQPKIRSGSSPLEESARGEVRRAAIDVTFVAATGCGPGISGRGNTGLAIGLTVPEPCYKGVKMKQLFGWPWVFPQSISIAGSRRIPEPLDVERVPALIWFIWQFQRNTPIRSFARPNGGLSRFLAANLALTPCIVSGPRHGDWKRF